MAGSPKYKIYDSFGVYQAACKEPEGGAALMSLYGIGATIRDGHSAKRIIWTEGEDGYGSDSWDAVAVKCAAYHQAVSEEWARKIAIKEGGAPVAEAGGI